MRWNLPRSSETIISGAASISKGHRALSDICHIDPLGQPYEVGPNRFSSRAWPVGLNPLEPRPALHHISLCGRAQSRDSRRRRPYWARDNCDWSRIKHCSACGANMQSSRPAGRTKVAFGRWREASPQTLHGSEMGARPSMRPLSYANLTILCERLTICKRTSSD